MAKKKYWQGFTELTETAAHQKMSNDEFQEDLPFEAGDGKSFTEAPASRRDFLKYLGFSTAAAMAAASCQTPVNKAIPYLNKPQNLVPGVADYYATTYVSGGEAISVVAKVRDGRPIKLEGNTLSSLTKGNTSARVQAAVLDLYDTARIRTPMITNGDKKIAVSMEAADKDIAAALASAGPIVLLTSTIHSPTTKQITSEFLAKYPGSKHIQFDAVSYSALLLANETTYGKKAIPSYHFDQAKVIVSLGADFLGTWLSPVEFGRQYTAGRKINEKNPEMSKHYHFESMLSMTGANADDRYTHRPSETGAVAAALLSAVQGQGTTGVQGNIKKGIEAAAKSLLEHKGKALVVAGSNNVNVQLIVNAINEAVGANGTTINWASPIQTYQGIDSEMEMLVADMEGGKVGALIIYGVNPSYEYYNSARFSKALKGLKVSVSLNDHLDETTELCKYVVPSHHFLESWGDAEPKAGYLSLMQPTINPLFQTRQFQDTLLKWSGNPTTYETYCRNVWISKLGNLEIYNKALQDGVVETSVNAAGSAFNGASIAGAVAAVAGMKKSDKTELVIYQKVSLGDGKQANNPWLQEMPDPITKATWDNYAMVSPQFGKNELGIDITNQRQADNYEVFMEKPLVKFTINKKEYELPVLIIPGMQANTIAIAVGYGRSEKTGLAANGVGQNAYPLLGFNGTTVDWFSTDVSYAKWADDKKFKVAQTQTHSNYEGRHEVIKEVTLGAFIKNPNLIVDERMEEIGNFGGIDNYAKEGTLYPQYDRPGIKWGMSIDLNSCFGCGACSVACTAENNVPVVGKNEVLRFHEMHWMRIDRYFSGNINDADSIQTIFQPMLCQHCDNAPCENVCPVAATNHSSEGLNQMTYNRCIGTRYCANNCPYKVRRFNWLDYTGADSFPDNQLKEGVGALNDVVFMMNDDLTRMVLNPDVTVRSRGVIEKCSFCVQRLQEGKLKAKKEDRVLQDDDIKTACQQACPGDAIVFGNANNADSEISQVRKNNSLRTFYSLEQIHVLPNVNYLAKVRNTELLAAHTEAHEGGAAHEEVKEAGAEKH
ncbi:MAG: TAT-variant-translocated molybdopterin oxidoreductase [Chitinophagaceae bacterium]